MLGETTERSTVLTNAFRHENDRQSKEFEYIELQNSVLTEEHQKMHEVSNELSSRTNDLENKVGA